MRESTHGTLEAAFRVHLESTRAELLKRLIGGTPEFFESVVVNLLIALKYGKAGEIVGKTCDGGIDGIVYEDKLGFERIHIQAKRWKGSVGRPELQKFYGALQGVSAKKGVFITTSTFTRHVYDYVVGLPIPIVLIDGQQLADLMYDTNLGVVSKGVFEVKSIDPKYFSEDPA